MENILYRFCKLFSGNFEDEVISERFYEKLVLNFQWSLRPAIMRNRSQNAKNEKRIARYFAPLFSCFAPLFSLFAFHSILCQGGHLRKNSKDFVVYFFCGINRTRNLPKMWKCVVSILHLLVYFAKTFAKCSWNAKYEKCIAFLRNIMKIL